MQFEFNNLAEMILTLNTEEKCKTFYEWQRWKGNVRCPHCNHQKVWRTKDGFRCADANCYKKFTVKTKSVFENSNLPLQKWFIAIYLCTAHKKGVSSCQLARDISVTQKTAWFMLHRIREIFTVREAPELSGNIECDETFVGGKNKNRHKNKKVKNNSGRSFKDKTPVLGMIQRGGELRAFVVPNTGPKIIEPIVVHNIATGATLMTDEWCAYAEMNRIYNHAVVDHSKGQYVTPEGSTNNMECYWSHLKRGLFGIYHHVSPKHLQSYVDESVFRYNSRQIKDSERAIKALEYSTSKRLSYKQLIQRYESRNQIH